MFVRIKLNERDCIQNVMFRNEMQQGIYSERKWREHLQKYRKFYSITRNTRKSVMWSTPRTHTDTEPEYANVTYCIQIRTRVDEKSKKSN